MNIMAKGTGPVFQTVSIRGTLIMLTPTTTSIPARTGMGRISISRAKISKVRAANSPVKILAQRETPPTLWIRVVPDSDPPTGIPPTRPTARLPAPCPRKSPDGSGYSPSAMARAGPIIAGMSEKSGSCGIGSPRGISVVSPTTATESKAGSKARRVINTNAIAKE